MLDCFEQIKKNLTTALDSIVDNEFNSLVDDCEKVLRGGHRIIATGLGKNVPICEKFEGTMLSMGLDCHFMHTNTAIHGDLGMIRDNDLVIILTKSGSTEESVLLYHHLLAKNCSIWLLSFNRDSLLYQQIKNHISIELSHEGDLWNLVPNNSSTMNLIVLQQLAIELSKRFNLTLADFKKNHPGGAIGKYLDKLNN